MIREPGSPDRHDFTCFEACIQGGLALILRYDRGFLLASNSFSSNEPWLHRAVL
jgi:hypothetical protein